jgi:hypothetical protein
MTNSLSALLAVAALARNAEEELQARAQEHAREVKRRLTYRTNMIAMRKQGLAMQQIHQAAFHMSVDKKAAAKVYRTKMMEMTDSMQRQQQKFVMQALGLDASHPIVIV